MVNNTTDSGTGSGSVFVNAGTLSGTGTIAGKVTVGTGSGFGAFLAPGKNGREPGALTVQSTLTFKTDATYTYRINTNEAKADKVVASRATIDSGAQCLFVEIGDSVLTPGTVFTAIKNNTATPIAGTFSNLADGSTITIGNNTFQASYEGGDGNDLTLTVVPYANICRRDTDS